VTDIDIDMLRMKRSCHSQLKDTVMGISMLSCSTNCTPARS